MQVFVLQGEHFSQSGRPMSVHATMKSANEEAASLVAVIREDYLRLFEDEEKSTLEKSSTGTFAEPTPATWQLVLNDMQDYENEVESHTETGEIADLVWITEFDVKGFIEWIDSPDFNSPKNPNEKQEPPVKDGECSVCGRDYRGDEVIGEGEHLCPADDCPSNCEEAK